MHTVFDATPGTPPPAPLAAFPEPAPADFHPQGYVVTVRNDLMAPEACRGDVVLVEPVPPRAGELAVIVKVGHPLPALFRMAAAFEPHLPAGDTPGKGCPFVEFEATNPRRRYWLDRRTIAHAHRVHSVVRAGAWPAAPPEPAPA